MIEAVGEEYWPTYFAAIDALLAPGGSAVVQAILMDHDRYLMTRNSYGWIQKYIFPGGLIPSLTAIREVTATHTPTCG
jgi:cyclopropane-fatty-acyl-phospholipid synthase